MKRYLLVLFLLGVSSGSFAQFYSQYYQQPPRWLHEGYIWVGVEEGIPYNYPKLEVVETSKEELTIKMTIPGYTYTKVELEGEDYYHIHFLEYDDVLDKCSNPTIPQSPIWVLIPKGKCIKEKGISLIPVKCDTTILDRPIGPTYQIDEYPPVLRFNEDVYTKKISYPSSPFWTREHRYDTDLKAMYRAIVFTPFKYDIANSTLILYSESIIKIKFSDIDEEVKMPRATGYELRYDESYYKNKYINYNYYKANREQYTYGTPLANTTTPKNELMIVDEAWQNSIPLMALRDWRTRMGVRCQVESIQDFGYNPTDIKLSIMAESPSSVLFIGDEQVIPPYSVSHIKQDSLVLVPSDYYYGVPDTAEHYKATIPIGRFTVKSHEDLKNMIYKSINYEKRPRPGNWEKKMLLSAAESSITYPYEDCKEEIRLGSYQVHPLFSTAYADSGATNSNISVKINSGIGILNFRGHGYTAGWSWTKVVSSSRPPFDTACVNRLSNLIHPVVFSLSCNTGNISADSDCFLESFAKGPHGSVAIVAATTEVGTYASSNYDKKYFLHMLNDSNAILGKTHIVSLSETIDAETNRRNSLPRDLAEICALSYLWNADPELEIWTDTLTTDPDMTVTDNGGSSIIVNTNISSPCDVIVCGNALDIADSSLGVYKNVISSVTVPNVVRPYYVTIRKHNHTTRLSDTYIQNKTLTGNKYVSGKDILVGSNVTTTEPAGDVTVAANANVVLCPSNRVKITSNFSTTNGSSFRIQNTNL